jgi:hypothetical protein
VSGIAFLILAVALSLVGSLVLWLRARPPRSMEHGIETFSRGMAALAQERAPRGRRQPGPPPRG